jgi:TetR/AcrR family transcriptional regulator, lmrAB and yxaGH operons repressor
MSDTKQKMIRSAMLILAKRGLEGTSFAEVLADSGAPRGSVYHHFPGGKTQLVEEALQYASEWALREVEKAPGSSAKAVTAAFLDLWRKVLVESKLKAGCSVLAVAVAADTPKLRERAAAVFRAWRERLARALERGGLKKADARRFAATLLAASEGAVAVARAEQDLEPFELVAAQLLAQVTQLSRPVATRDLRSKRHAQHRSAPRISRVRVRSSG